MQYSEEYIYKLTDPFTMEVRYIGRTIEPLERLKAHIYQTGGGSDKDIWIIGLRNSDTFPIMEVIETVTSANGAERERYWIKFYKRQGSELFNKVHNRPGFNVIGYKKRKSKQAILSDCFEAMSALPSDILAQDKWTLLTLITYCNGEEAPQIYTLEDLSKKIGVSVGGLYSIIERLQNKGLIFSRRTNRGTSITTYISRLTGEMEEGE